MNEKEKQSFGFRLRVISFAITLFAILIVIRLFIVQVVNVKIYKDLARDSYVQVSTEFDRGDIYFTDKYDSKVVAATITSGYILAVNPTKITDAEKLYEDLSAFVEIEKETFMLRATKENDPYEEILNHLSREDANNIREQGLSGVVLSKDHWRSYPGGDLSSQLLGFLAFENDDLAGRYGLERNYESFLVRKTGDINVNAFAEVFSNISKTFQKKEKERPADIVTNIDPVIQRTVQQVMESVNDEFSAEEAYALVIDPQTGAIVAGSQTPSFDLNNFGEVDDISVYRNALVENVYEFGSVIKPLVVAAGLDSNSINPDTSFFDEGSVVVEDATISNFDGKGRGWVTMSRALSESLNTAMVFVMKETGREEFKKYMLSYELGERSGIDLPNEARGLMSNLDSPRMIEYATASFGQGISTSHVALAKALSALGNGGYLVQPHVVKEIEFEDGEIREVLYNKESSPRVFTGQTSQDITTMLVSNVDTNISGGKYSKEKYSVAAKTGTAQIPDPEGGYYDDRNLHAFFGYFPAYDPQYLVLLTLKNPKNVKYSSETLIKPFFEISDFIINYAEILPDR